MKQAQLLFVLFLLSSLTLSLPSFADGGVLGFVAKDGLFVSGDLGIFASLNGYEGNTPRAQRTLSTIEPLIGLTIGYDFSRNFGIGLKLANASVADAALSPGDPESPTDFGFYLADANLMGAMSVSKRVRLVANGFGGLTVMSTRPALGASPYSYNLGASIGVLYDTLLADVVVGLNVAGYAFLGLDSPADAKTNVFGASITPVLKYVF